MGDLLSYLLFLFWFWLLFWLLFCVLFWLLFWVRLLFWLFIICYLLFQYSRESATIVYPLYQDLSFGLNRKLASSPEKMAVVIPPAVAFSPPVNMPRKPS